MQRLRRQLQGASRRRQRRIEVAVGGRRDEEGGRRCGAVGPLQKLEELRESYQPFFPVLLGRQEAVPHVAEKLHLHDVDLIDRDARHICPRLVSVRVVVEKLVAQHECNREQPILAALAAIDLWVGYFEPVDEEQSQQNDVLRDLGRGEDRLHPLLEISACTRALRYPSNVCSRRYRSDLVCRLEHFRRLKPKESREISNQVSQVAAFGADALRNLQAVVNHGQISRRHLLFGHCTA